MNPQKAAALEQIRGLIDARVRAVLQRDTGRIVAANNERIVTFDVVSPLRNVGEPAVRARTEKWLEGYAEGPGYEVRDVEIMADGNLGFAYYLYRVSGTLKNGTEVSMWVRSTLGVARKSGRWQVVHQHDSVPFDPESGKASLDLTP